MLSVNFSAIAEQKQAAEEYNRDVAAAMQEAADRGDLEEEEAEAAWARLMAENEQVRSILFILSSYAFYHR